MVKITDHLQALRTLLLPVLVLLLLGGCQKDHDDAPVPPPAADQAIPGVAVPGADPPSPEGRSTDPGNFGFDAAPALAAPLLPLVVETPSAALFYWRQLALDKPALLLFSNDPFLLPIPEPLREPSLRLVQQAGLVEIRRGGTQLSSNPLLASRMTVTAALEAGFFSELIWVVPFDGASATFDPEALRGQLLDYGVLPPEEAQALTLTEGRIQGTVHGIPFRAGPLERLGKLQRPALVHFDLSYFQPLYKNEIKTPLFPLIRQTFLALRDLRAPVGAATLSCSNLEGQVPLDARFVAPVIGTLFEHPDILDQALPPNWDRRGRAMYLANFFKKEEVRDLYRQMEREAPRDASVKYALYQVARQFKEGDQALDYLAQAVALDPVYALEYLALATVAEEKGRSDRTLEMLERAARALPHNSFIPLQMAQFHLRQGDFKRALELIEHLQGLNWSPTYHPGVPPMLEQMRAAAMDMMENQAPR